jgi:hypothetical protein
MSHRTFEEVKHAMVLAAGQDVIARALVQDFERHAVAYDARLDGESRYLMQRRNIAPEDAADAGFLVFLPDARGFIKRPDDQSTSYLDNFNFREEDFDAITLCVPETESLDLWFGLKALMEWHKLQRSSGFEMLAEGFTEAINLVRMNGGNRIAIANLRKESFKARQAHVLETNQLINALAYRVFKQQVLGEKFQLRIPKDITVSQATRYITVQFAEALEANLPPALSDRERRSRAFTLFAAVYGVLAEQKVTIADDDAS